jgi:predicted Zn-dependent protease
LGAAQSLLDEVPGNRDVLLTAAISLRHLRRMPEALAMLDRLERLHPRFSRLHQERGLCHVGLKDASRAIEALLLCVNINPALPSSWNMLEGLYRLTGDEENASTAAAHIATLARLPPEVVTATSLYSDGDLAPAEQIVRAYLLAHGDHPEAMRLLARIGMARDVLDDAELLLEALLAMEPDYTAARYDYAQTLVQRHKYAPARDQIRRLLDLDPGNLDYRSLAATAAVGLGEHQEAIGLYACSPTCRDRRMFASGSPTP